MASYKFLFLTFAEKTQRSTELPGRSMQSAEEAIENDYVNHHSDEWLLIHQQLSTTFNVQSRPEQSRLLVHRGPVLEDPQDELRDVVIGSVAVR